MSPPSPLLEVRGLCVAFRRRKAAPLRVLSDIDLTICPGEVVGVVGESASGKTTLAASLLRLLDEDAIVEGGQILWRGQDLLSLDERAMAPIRGREIAMVFQDPMTALDPLIPIGRQVAEVIQAHNDVGRAEALAQAEALLARVGLDRAMARRRPFALSGGQRQRALIAMAVSNRPALIIADEPTTALDATIQAEVLALLKDLSREVGAAILLITHDLGVIAQMADRLHVMYAGRVVESGAARRVLTHPRAPYSWGLMDCAPGLGDVGRTVSRPIPGLPPSLEAPPSGCAFQPRCAYAQDICRQAMPPLVELEPGETARCHFAGMLRPEPAPVEASVAPAVGAPLLEIRGLTKVFAGATAPALDGVDLMLGRGEVLGVVGESGCGKTTLGRIMVRLTRPTAGSVSLEGVDAASLEGAGLRAYRRRVQMVFQDPYASLNPRMRVLDAVAEPLRMTGQSWPQARQAAGEMLQRCGLPGGLHQRFPHAFSGGQRQRIGIARALVLSPDVVVLDEPVSALDVSIQAQILMLLRQMRQETGAAFVFISHDLAVVRQLADRVAVMRQGRVVELAPSEAIFSRPQHPYTQALLAAAPRGLAAEPIMELQ